MISEFCGRNKKLSFLRKLISKIYEAGSRKTLSADVNMFSEHIRNDATMNKFTKNI